MPVSKNTTTFLMVFSIAAICLCTGYIFFPAKATSPGPVVTSTPEMVVATSTPEIIPLAPTSTPPKVENEVMTGVYASWYDYDLPGYPGYSKKNFTAASRHFKKGTRLFVCDHIPEDFRVAHFGCVVVRVNDFGPEAGQTPDRVIDLSSAAFEALYAPMWQGLAKVDIIVVENDYPLGKRI